MEHVVNRTFSTPDDLYAVFSKMVEKGEWEAFQRKQYINSPLKAIDGTFDSWLSCYGCPEQIPERLSMAAEWIERGKG